MHGSTECVDKPGQERECCPSLIHTRIGDSLQCPLDMWSVAAGIARAVGTEAGVFICGAVVCMCNRWGSCKTTCQLMGVPCNVMVATNATHLKAVERWALAQSLPSWRVVNSGMAHRGARLVVICLCCRHVVCLLSPRCRVGLAEAALCIRRHEKQGGSKAMPGAPAGSGGDHGASAGAGAGTGAGQSRQEAEAVVVIAADSVPSTRAVGSALVAALVSGARRGASCAIVVPNTTDEEPRAGVALCADGGTVVSVAGVGAGDATTRVAARMVQVRSMVRVFLAHSAHCVYRLFLNQWLTSSRPSVSHHGQRLSRWACAARMPRLSGLYALCQTGVLVQLKRC